MAADESKQSLKTLIQQVVDSRIDANRRYIDQVLEQIEDANHQYYLQRLGNELREMELAQQEGKTQLVMHHRVMADTFKSILENCFSSSSKP